MIDRIILLSVIFFMLPNTSFSIERVVDCKDSYSTTVVTSDRLIDAGDNIKALSYLNSAIFCYPNRDILLMRRGRIYYKLSDLVNSEKDFMEALKLNIDNDTAFAFTEKIRLRKTHMETEESQRLSSVIESVVVEGFFTIVAIAFGFAFGSLIKLRPVEQRLGLRKANKLSNSFEREDHMEIGLFLERQLSNLNYIIVDSFMVGLCKSIPYSEIESFLNRNIYNDDNRTVLYKMFDNHKEVITTDNLE